MLKYQVARVNPSNNQIIVFVRSQEGEMAYSQDLK